jgi:hypothetical protein
MISQYDTPFRFENIVICAAARVSFKIQNERTHVAVCDGLASSFAPQLRRSATPVCQLGSWFLSAPKERRKLYVSLLL